MTREKRLQTLFIIYSVLLTVATSWLLIKTNQNDLPKPLPQNCSTHISLPGPRGLLYDRHNQALCQAHSQCSAFVDRTTVTSTHELETYLENNFPRVYEQWQTNRHQNFFWVARCVSTEEQKALAQACPDIHFIFEPSRWYCSPFLPEVIGTTNIDTQGIAGIEHWADRHLAGTATVMQLHKNSPKNTDYFVEYALHAGAHGRNMQLCIDQTFSLLVQKMLESSKKKYNATRTGAIIMNPQNGQILCLAQTPSYNPNASSCEEQRKNYLVSSCYEFGSIMALFSALAALSNEQITPETLINCQGKHGYINGHCVTNETPLGTVPFWQAVARGGNVGVATACKNLKTKLYDHLSRLGFGAPTGVELPDERSGFINPPERWSAASPLFLSYGYEIMATPLHVAKALSIIANGGHLIRPTLLFSDRNTTHGMQLYSARTITHIKDILTRACTQYGITIKDYSVAGLAGCAHLLHNGKYTKKPSLFSFAGIIEKDEYKRVIITFIEKPKKSASAACTHAATLFTDIANTMILHEQLNPPPYQIKA